MKNSKVSKMVSTCISAIFLISLLGSCESQTTTNDARLIPSSVNTNGTKAKVFLSDASQNEMIVPQQDLSFQQDFETENQLICVYPEFQYQEILGFGGAFTEATAYNYMLMTPAQRQQVIELLFSKTNGIGFNFCRTHINSSDYGLGEYTYVEEGDVELKTFNIDREREHIVPMIKDALKVNPDILLYGSPWSPPAWMKDNKIMIQGGRLLPEYWQPWANYYARYFEEYKKEGINFFALTIQNEAKAVQTWESCIYTGEEEGLFAANYLRPALDKAGFKDIKIMIWDHNKERVMERARASFSIPGAKEAIWGIAHHWYSGDHFDNLRMMNELFPDKPYIATENGAGGPLPGAPNYWNSVTRYAQEAIMDMNNGTCAVVAWNMILDQYGTPIHNRNNRRTIAEAAVPYVPIPAGAGGGGQITYNTDTEEFEVRTGYYTIGHFSKFIQRGAIRIGSSTYSDNVKAVALINPNGEIVIVVLNLSGRDANPKIRLNDCTAEFNMPANSLQTIIVQGKYN